MGMPATERTKRWTAEEVRAMQDEDRAWPRYELVDGELLVTPAPRPVHQRAVRQLLLALHPYVTAHRLGEVLTAPADIGLEPESVVQPDVFVVPGSGGPPARSWTDVRALLLAVEVLSPGTARQDRTRKRRFFRRMGVPEYWMVDTEQRIVERARPDDDRVELADERLRWQPAGAAEPFVLELAGFFARVQGEEGEPAA
jgi:Uma2 family endonuclease